MSNAIFAMYVAYITLSVGMTVWVARTLSIHGRHFLVDVFGGDQEKADATNHLLVVGFYLVNLGMVCFHMATAAVSVDARMAVELLSEKVGFVLAVLGGMHFFNLYVLSRLRRSAKQKEATAPPLAPTSFVQPVGVRGM